MKPGEKSIFKSKTILASVLTAIAGGIGSVFPEANQFLSNNASSILLVLGALNVGLRLVTRGRIVLYRD